MKGFAKAGVSNPVSRDVRIFGRQQIIQSCRRPRLISTAIATSQEATFPGSSVVGIGEGYSVSQAVNETDFYSQQAFIADYQYALRYYRSLKQHVVAWQAEFKANHRGDPSVEDAAQHGGPDFAQLYSSFLEVRSRLLVELPHLRAKLLNNQEAEPAASNEVQHARQGGRSRHGSVNANSCSPVTSNLPHLAEEQHQVVDSVSTWLRADRYRRQRAVTAPGALGSAPGVAALPELRPMTDEEGSVTRPVTPGPVLPDLEEASLPVAGAGGDQAPHLAAAPWNSRPLGGEQQGERKELAAGSGAREAYGRHEQHAQQYNTVGSVTTRDHESASAIVSESRKGYQMWEGEGPQQQQLVEVSSDARHVTETPSVPTRSAFGGGPAAMVQPASAAFGPSPASEDRLAEDASMAADSRAKNALLAALQYKRAGRIVGASSPRVPESPGQSPERAAASGDEANGRGPEAGDSGTVVGEVQRGDAAGAYMGRIRRTDTLPEAFLVCP